MQLLEAKFTDLCRLGSRGKGRRFWEKARFMALFLIMGAKRGKRCLKLRRRLGGGEGGGYG